MSLGPFRVGDSPANPIQIDLIDEDSETDLTDYGNGTAVMLDPSGETVATLAEVDIEDDSLTFPFPVDPFAVAGIYTLVPTIATTGHHLTLAPIEFVVSAEDGWHTVDSIRAALNNDFTGNDVQAWTLLDVAKTEVVAFAPALADDAPVPVAYKQAQLMQCRNILNSVKTDPSQIADDTGFVIRPYPLDKFIKGMLRPPSGLPVLA